MSHRGKAHLSDESLHGMVKRIGINAHGAHPLAAGLCLGKGEESLAYALALKNRVNSHAVDHHRMVLGRPGHRSVLRGLSGVDASYPGQYAACLCGEKFPALQIPGVKGTGGVILSPLGIALPVHAVYGTLDQSQMESSSSWRAGRMVMVDMAVHILLV